MGGQNGSGPVLECVGLTRRFGDRMAVDGVSLRIAPGETYGLLLFFLSIARRPARTG
jgi:hypothetical protein